ncbi:TIGR03899 family protein [Rheinheimera baltica]|uniref:TIGR03899 family protein n=1 Tax=Rheinheimera baltica TaxID=67576 RepID=A0ABT9I090_9GAMM|nr:TIGR03899 family protein [Rheinheimera baltica]MDP5136783.1 TIGR03899 family protein [Rheinheimera baltica]MDP5144328.1 TIGR03899 family protein [Rheinheimera baltica]MDP5151454.1 TIGR03899 family protein [Rheinheimera baltica]MDP5190021.1 TIGR03899 family protein [Rheinheimera baltica]
MVKVNSLSAQQRLLQLAKTQFGAGISTSKDIESTNNTQDQGQFSDKHQQLAARSGAIFNSASLNINQRAERRLQMQRERQQHNLERIMAQALEYCPESVSAQDVDPDWFQQFCDLILDISNTNMQHLWAKILAGEIATPGKFSLKTLHTLKRMSYKEAMALQQAANLSCRTRQDPSARIYFGYISRPSLWRLLTGRSRAVVNLNQFGLSYPQILSLMDIGLLHSSEIESGTLPAGQQLNWQYQQLSMNGTVCSKDVVLQYYKYTASGAELLPLLNAQPNQQYVEALKQLLVNIIRFAP